MRRRRRQTQMPIHCVAGGYEPEGQSHASCLVLYCSLTGQTQFGHREDAEYGPHGRGPLCRLQTNGSRCQHKRIRGLGRG